MEALERRVAHLERSHRWRMLGIGAVGLMVGSMLGAGNDPMHATLRGSSLVIVDAAGQPVIDLGVDESGSGRMHIRGENATAQVVLSAGADGGSLDLFASHGDRLAHVGASPTHDGMIVLNDAAGRALVRAGRWTEVPGGAVWKASVNESTKP